MDFLDGKILVSVSTEQVENKDSDIWKTLHYRKTEIRLSKLTELIKQQYAFCGVFEESEFTQSQKIKSNWVGAYIVPIDLDERKLNYTQFLEQIKKVTLCQIWHIELPTMEQREIVIAFYIVLMK